MQNQDLKREMSRPTRAADFYARLMQLSLAGRRPECETQFLQRVGPFKAFADEFTPIAYFCKLHLADRRPGTVIEHVLGNQRFDARISSSGAEGGAAAFLEVTCLEDKREHDSRTQMSRGETGRLTFKRFQVVEAALDRFKSKCCKPYSPTTTLLIYNKFPVPALTLDLARSLREAKANINCPFEAVFVLDTRVCVEI